MKLSSALRSTDKYLCDFACLLARLIRTFFLFRSHENAKTLIIRPGGMGDLVCLTIALENLNIKSEQAFWIIEDRSRLWAERLKLDFLCYDSAPLKTLFHAAGRYRVVINTEQKYGLAQALAVISSAKNGQVFSFNTNRCAKLSNTQIQYDPYAAHETVEFKKIIAAGFNKEFSPAKPDRAQNCDRQRGCVVGIAGCDSFSRSFSAEEWTQLLSEWLKGRPLCIVCRPQDSALAKQIIKQLNCGGTILDSDFSEVCEAISHAEEFFTVDGGLLHIASYYGVKTTVIFTSGRDSKWTPLGAGSVIIKRTDLDCQPCTIFGHTPPCKFSLRCKEISLTLVNPDKVSQKKISEPVAKQAFIGKP